MELAEVKHSSLWVQESSWLIHGLFRVTKRQKHLKQFGRTESRKCYFGKASGGNRNWTEKPGPRLFAHPLWRHVVASCPLALSASAEWPALEMGQGCRPDYVRHWRRPEYLQEHKCCFFCVSVCLLCPRLIYAVNTMSSATLPSLCSWNTVLSCSPNLDSSNSPANGFSFPALLVTVMSLRALS